MASQNPKLGLGRTAILHGIPQTRVTNACPVFRNSAPVLNDLMFIDAEIVPVARELAGSMLAKMLIPCLKSRGI